MRVLDAVRRLQRVSEEDSSTNQKTRQAAFEIAEAICRSLPADFTKMGLNELSYGYGLDENSTGRVLLVPLPPEARMPSMRSVFSHRDAISTRAAVIMAYAVRSGLLHEITHRVLCRCGRSAADKFLQEFRR